MRSLPAFFSGLCVALAADPTGARGADLFQEQVAPFLKTYCVECHNAKRSEGELNLARFSSAAMLGEQFRQWDHVIGFLQKQEMPPAKAKQPTAEERAAAIRAIQQTLSGEAKKLSGDPGPVLPRRLTNAEYNNSVRDLTGHDLRPADSFPVDPASGEGFRNTGEALAMSTSLFKKYYAAAQQVADHVIFTPDGFVFSPQVALTYADRKQHHEQAILRFYERHAVDYQAYLAAAWAYRHRPAAARNVSLDDWARERGLSGRYLRTLWETLQGEPPDDHFILSPIRKAWNELPPPTDPAATALPGPVRGQIATLAERIVAASKRLCPKENEAIGANAGNGPIQHIDRRTRTAGERDRFDAANLTVERRFTVELKPGKDQATAPVEIRAWRLGAAKGPLSVTLERMHFSNSGNSSFNLKDAQKYPSLRSVLEQHAPEQLKAAPFVPGEDGAGSETLTLSADQTVRFEIPVAALQQMKAYNLHLSARLNTAASPDGMARLTLTQGPAPEGTLEPAQWLVDPERPAAARIKASGEAFCRVFPNRFYYVNSTRGLSAGFHLIEGFFRDDQPLCTLVLDEAQRRELDRLWDELYFGTEISERMLRGFVFFERSERNFMKHPDFDPIKEEDPALVTDEKLQQFEQIYLARSGIKPEQAAESSTHRFFEAFRQGLRRRREQLAAAQPIYLGQLLTLAERAYRRPLSDAEKSRLEKFYLDACRNTELGVEQAVRGVVISLLVSPHFCFLAPEAPPGDTVAPLADLALASRLSYFLWASAPDSELLTLAREGTLRQPAVLRAQTRRMLRDPRVAGFALEFFGQWLRHRDFREQEAVDRKAFPAFDEPLKQAMFEEPTRLATDLIQNDLPATDLLYGDATFVNQRLAQHYGLPFTGDPQSWQKVEGLRGLGRGGVLGMAVFLTQNSQPQRTSPVKRGFWVVHKVLGEHIPPPPANVAVLPAKETETDGKTIRELLALHVEVESCARCHARFDPIGLAMEGFDPIGRARSKDLAGRPVDNLVSLPNGKQARGVPEFAAHLQAARTEEFAKTLCHKFLGYALGRSVEFSDQELLDRMQTEWKEQGYRFHALFDIVVSSPQFLNQRCRNFSLASFRKQVEGRK